MSVTITSGNLSFLLLANTSILCMFVNLNIVGVENQIYPVYTHKGNILLILFHGADYYSFLKIKFEVVAAELMMTIINEFKKEITKEPIDEIIEIYEKRKIPSKITCIQI